MSVTLDCDASGTELITFWWEHSIINGGQWMNISNSNAKQKHLGCKKVRGQSKATLQTGRRNQKV